MAVTIFCAELRRELISAKPNSDGREFNKGKIVDNELVVSGGAASTADLVEETLITSSAIQIGTEAFASLRQELLKFPAMMRYFTGAPRSFRYSVRHTQSRYGAGRSLP